MTNPHFHYQNNQLYVEHVSLENIATQFQTPTYIYSYQAIIDQAKQYRNALKNRRLKICYAVKANSNLAILQLLASLGFHFDVVSGGELKRVLTAGGKGNQIVFSGVGKSKEEIQLAIQHKIYCFNVESEAELRLIAALAEKEKKKINIAIRINPDIKSKTHRHISTGSKENKFGIPIEQAFKLYQFAHQHRYLKIRAIHCHIGSQIFDLNSFVQAAKITCGFAEKLSKQGIELEAINLGGGLGIRYRNREKEIDVKKYLHQLDQIVPPKYQLMIEPGRSLIAHAGVLLTRIHYLKSYGKGHKQFAIVDAAMNDLIRPALYNAYHEIIPVLMRKEKKQKYDIVGPVCETSDCLGKNRKLAIEENDLLVIQDAGAYGMTMSSNYNTRNRAAECLVKGNKIFLIRERETFEQQIEREKLIDEI